MTEQDINTIDCMSRYGGSFCHLLAEAARRADPHNLQKIKSAFSQYWDEYTKMSQDPKFAIGQIGQDRHSASENFTPHSNVKEK